MTAANITRLIALALLAHFALCWPLWDVQARASFPAIPLIALPVSGHLIGHAGMAWLTVVLTACIAVWPRKRWLLAAWAAWMTGMVLLDVNRLQPWLYFYGLSAGLLLFPAGTKQESAIPALRWLIAAVYAWGGFNKLTPYFAEDNFPWFCEAFVWTKPLGQFPWVGYAVALAELALAPGLLWMRSWAAFRWIAIAFHGFIILALSPLGLNWNTVVIPWNIAMAGMIWLLFRPDGQQEALIGSWKSLRPIPAGIVLFLAWVMPAANIGHRWDEPLSWKMYCNTQTEATFSHPGLPYPALAPVWSQYAFDDGTKLLLDDWAFQELHVPAYNSRWVQLQLGQCLCQHAARPDLAELMLLQVERWDRTREKWERVRCGGLNLKNK